jgi:DnaK suppressor protein
MTSADRAEIKACVEAGIAATKEAVAAQESEGKSIAPDQAIGYAGRIDAMYSQQLNAGTLQRSKERLARLEYVLSRIEAPDFGRCEFCQAPIPVPRLKAMPECTTCMRCAAFAT